MEKARLKLWYSKKKKFVGDLVLESNKTMSLEPWFLRQIDESYNNKECLVERSKGQPVKFVVDKKEFIKPPDKSSTSQKPKGKGAKSYSKHSRKEDYIAAGREAVAPYNFVPLNNKVVITDNEPPPLNCYDLSCKSGWIELEIETFTPFFIRGTTDSKKLGEEEGNVKEDHEFFSPGGKLKIPGSSLRGMIRTLVEVVGHGKFNNIDGDRKLYYRAIAEPAPLGPEYRANMIDQETNQLRVKGGLLRSSNKPGVFEILPSPSNGSNVYRVRFDARTGKVAGSNVSLNIPKDENYNYIEIYFEPGELDRPVKNVYSQKPSGKDDNICEGYLVYSGLIPKKNKQWIIEKPQKEQKPLEIPTQVAESYQKDENRNAVDLLEKAKKSKQDGVPCFYLNKNEEVISFGHTGMFRLAYGKSIADHLPETMKTVESGFDLAESMFGVESQFSSRVYFEDAGILPGQDNPFLSNEYVHPKILSTPKPTTFQHYLEQGKGKGHEVVDRKELQSWNSDQHLRGYKLFWHRDVNQAEANDTWKALEDQVAQYPKQYSYRIKPIKEGVKFTGVIRFENLSEIELGALLFVLDLPDNCYHKLGLAKPLGFGSIKIKPSIYLVDRSNRYKKLFENNKWYLAEESGDINKLKEVFAEWILGELSVSDELKEGKVKEFWNLPRMQELKCMLSWPPLKQSWLKETRYMEIKSGRENEFRNRPVLPKPSHVLQKHNKTS